MEFKYLRTRQAGATLWVEIHNPPVNWLTIDICEELFVLARRVEKDPSIRVFILTGGIEDVYIMHFSIPELVKISPDNEKIMMDRIFRSRILGRISAYFTTLSNWLMDWVPGYEAITLKNFKAIRNYSSTLFLWFQMHRLYLAIERMGKITIAAINGPCNGGGTELSACFDFRFMIHDQDFTIGQPEVLVGIIAGGGGSQRLPRLLGKARALEIMLTGKQLTPEEAKAIGLITDHFAKEEFRHRVQEFADVMSRRIPVAVAGTKLAVHDGFEASLRHGLSLEMEQTIRCFASPMTKKALPGYASFLKKRVEVPRQERATIHEVIEMLQGDDFLNSLK
ncbi:MAG TPA: enoyl-CoA hydratase/isomerase family protein [Desulfomonilia bacterium]|nr:enoyl-CoA hydratase/isomerase family protein [Desulfomonilia bacterium]